MPRRFAKSDYPDNCPKCDYRMRAGHLVSWGGGSTAKHHDCNNLFGAGLTDDQGNGPDGQVTTDRYVPEDNDTPELVTVPNTWKTVQIPQATKPATNGHTNGNGLADVLGAALLPYIEERLNVKPDLSNVHDIVRTSVTEAMDANNSTLLDLVQSEISKVNAPLRIEVLERGEVRAIGGLSHKLVPRLLAFVSAGLNVWMHGAAGGGKSVAAEQVAEALGLEYDDISLNQQSQPSLILGSLTVTGSYVRTPFRERYEHGGIFFFDEIAAANGNFLTSLNTALENGHCAFPDGSVKRHDNFICIAADNTNGNGATAQYNTRVKIDAATRERYAFLEWEYDEKLERAVALSYNSKANAWVNWVQSVRSTVESLKLQLLASPRASKYGAMLLLHEPNVRIVADAVLFKGADRDTVSKVLASNPLPEVN